MRKLILLLLFWNFSGISLDAAFAGGVYIGNGGNVISCYQVEGLRFLDAYLAQTPEEAKKGPLSFVPIAHSPTEAATLLLEPLKILSPQRAVTYYSWLDHFFEEAILVNPLHARDIFPYAYSDVDLSTKILLSSRSCKIDVVIFQKDQVTTGEPRYLIVSTYWQDLATDEKAAAIVHEIIMRDFKEKFYYKTNVQNVVRNLVLYAKDPVPLHREAYLNQIKEIFRRFESAPPLGKPPEPPNWTKP